MSPETTANLKSKKTIPWQKIGQYSILLLLVVLFVWLVKSFLDGNFNSVESFQEYIQGFGIFGPIILIFVQLSQVVLSDSSGCRRLRGRLHPVWLAGGFLCNYIGISIGSIFVLLSAEDTALLSFSATYPLQATKSMRTGHRKKDFSGF